MLLLTSSSRCHLSRKNKVLIDSLCGSSMFMSRPNLMLVGMTLSVSSSRLWKSCGNKYLKLHNLIKIYHTLNPSKSNIDTTSVFLGPMWRAGNSLLLWKTSFIVANDRTAGRHCELWTRPSLTRLLAKLKFLCIFYSHTYFFLFLLEPSKSNDEDELSEKWVLTEIINWPVSSSHSSIIFDVCHRLSRSHNNGMIHAFKSQLYHTFRHGNRLFSSPCRVLPIIHNFSNEKLGKKREDYREICKINEAQRFIWLYMLLVVVRLKEREKVSQFPQEKDHTDKQHRFPEYVQKILKK